VKNTVFALQIIGIILSFYGIVFVYAMIPWLLIPTFIGALVLSFDHPLGHS
jgi:hypothetical protein